MSSLLVWLSVGLQLWGSSGDGHCPLAEGRRHSRTRTPTLGLPSSCSQRSDQLAGRWFPWSLLSFMLKKLSLLEGVWPQVRDLTALVLPAFSQMVISFYYGGKLVGQTTTTCPDGCRLSLSQPGLQGTKLFSAEGLELVRFPPADTIPSERQRQVTRKLFGHLERGVLLHSGRQGVFARRLCQGRVFCSGNAVVSKGGPNKLERDAVVQVFDTSQFFRGLCHGPSATPSWGPASSRAPGSGCQLVHQRVPSSEHLGACLCPASPGQRRGGQRLPLGHSILRLLHRPPPGPEQPVMESQATRQAQACILARSLGTRVHVVDMLASCAERLGGTVPSGLWAD